MRHILRSAAPTSYGAGDEATAGLSERELEVVRYLPTPLSSTEIAAQLYISLNTLKTHLGAIYRKLGVDGRRAAARRAVDLGIA
jgi:LuxR family maltose regulon positive regulatory protein